MLTPAAGLSAFAMPIFLGLAAWGVLGKMEKWAQGTAPPPRTPHSVAGSFRVGAHVVDPRPISSSVASN